MKREAPIGVFDSGLGGLTVVREIQVRLPAEDIIYFGDLARLPYGIKSKEQILLCSRENSEFLLQFGIKALVIACNSSASAATPFLAEQYSIPILDVIAPASAEAVRLTRNRVIGVLGTQATIASGAYEKKLKHLDRRVNVIAQACPLFVPLVEEGIDEANILRPVAEQYLARLKRSQADTVIMGCTHFPLLRETIQRTLGARVRLIDSAPVTVAQLGAVMEREGLSRNQGARGRLEVYVSDLSQNFLAIGERFLGRPLGRVKKARLQTEVTVKGKWTL
jgi:glutamate racemase